MVPPVPAHRGDGTGMSNAADRLARSRQAIIAQAQSRQRRREGRDDDEGADDAREPHSGAARGQHGAAGWLRHARHAVRRWWQHHPASMGVELVTPALAAYAARKPVQYLGLAALAGAVFVAVRPWRLVSVTGLIVAIAKSSQLSSVIMSAMAGADFGAEEDEQPPV